MAAPQPAIPPFPAVADLLLARRWRRERRLRWLHWAGAAACPALIPFFPGVSVAGAILLGLAVALGAAGETWLLRRRPTSRRLGIVRALATAIEWTAGLGVIVLRAYEAGAAAPALLLLLLVFTGARYGRPGVLGTTGGAALALGALVTAQVRLLGVLDAVGARDALRSWGWLVAGLAFALTLLLGPAEVRQRHAPPPVPRPPRGPAPRHSVRLSMRERAVLDLLAQEGAEELTIPEIARRLNVKPSSVTTYIGRLGVKLGVPHGGRRVIVQAARRQGLLPPRRDGPPEG